MVHMDRMLYFDVIESCQMNVEIKVSELYVYVVTLLNEATTIATFKWA